MERAVYKVPEVAKILGISRTHAYEMVAQGQIPFFRLGKRILVPKKAIEDLLSPVKASA